MGELSGLAKALPMAQDAIENAFKMHKKVSPEVIQAVKEYGEKNGIKMLPQRMESNGSFDNGSRLYNELKVKFGQDDAEQILKNAGHDSIETAHGSMKFGDQVAPDAFNSFNKAAAVAPAMGAATQMNPFEAAKDLGQKIKPAVDAYEGMKDQAAGKLADSMNFGHDPGFKQNATNVFSTALDPVNFVPGAPGAVMQGAQILGGMSEDAPQSAMGKGYAKGGEVMDFSKMKKMHSNETHTTVVHPDGHQIKLVHSKLRPENVKQLQDLPKFAEGGTVDWMDESTPSAEPQLSNPVIPSQQPQAAPTPNPSAQDPMQEAQQQQIQGIQQQANAAGQMGQQEQQAAQQQQQQTTDLNQEYTKNLASLDQERQAVMHDIGQGHIDPDHYVNNLSTAGKVGTAIGLILGGFAPSGKNPAMEFLQKNIDNDIEAQKLDLGRKENLLSANLRQFGNLHDATNMTKMIYNEIYSSKIAQAAAAAKSPMAQAAAQQAIGQLKAQSAPLLQELAQRQTVMQGLEGGALDPAMAVPHLVPKEHQKDVYNEIKSAQNTASNEGPMLEAFDKASKENTLIQTAGGLRTPAAILKMRAASLPMINDAEGRVNEFEQKTISDLEPKQGDTEAKIAQKRQALIQFMEQKKSAPTAKSFGIDLSKNRTTSSPRSKFKPAQ